MIAIWERERRSDPEGFNEEVFARSRLLAEPFADIVDVFWSHGILGVFETQIFAIESLGFVCVCLRCGVFSSGGGSVFFINFFNILGHLFLVVY